MTVHVINPLLDRRWEDLAARHPQATIFHQRAWLKALARTYGYRTFAITSAAPGEVLTDGIALCRVSSWITGSRLVSLPFADHCQPLLNERDGCAGFMDWLQAEKQRQHYKYAELRPLDAIEERTALQVGQSFFFHWLDLKPDLGTLYAGLHKDSFQRKIQRAEREGLSFESGRSEKLLGEFYRLLLITRRRHHLLPQPRAWFKNLVECMGDRMAIRVARKDGTAIAAMLTLRHRSTVVYKYGCSDRAFHNLGGMPSLFWRLIEESKAAGIEEIDLGRSDLDNPGLVTFKDRLGASKRSLTYYRYQTESVRSGIRWDSQTARQLFSFLPDPAFSAAGRWLYRHMG